MGFFILKVSAGSSDGHNTKLFRSWQNVRQMEKEAVECRSQRKSGRK